VSIGHGFCSQIVHPASSGPVWTRAALPAFFEPYAGAFRVDVPVDRHKPDFHEIVALNQNNRETEGCPEKNRP